MKTALLLTTFFFAFFSGNIYGSPNNPSGKDSSLLPLAPVITISGMHSRVLPATDGSRTVPLQVSDLLTTCQWVDVSNNSVVGSGSTFDAPVGQFKAVMLDILGVQVSSSVFTVVNANGSSKPDDAKNLAANLISSSAIQLTWDPVKKPIDDKKPKDDKKGPADNGQPNLTVNEIYRSTRPGSQYVLIYVTSADTSSYIDQNIESNTTYYYRVRNVNESGASALSKEVNVTTADDNIAPSAPSKLQAVNSTMTSIMVSWANSTDNVGVAQYYVYVNGVKVDSTSLLNYTINGLSPNTSYTITISASDFSGNNSAFSNAIKVITRGDLIAPTPPGNLKTVNTSASSIDISWNIATDNVAVTRYDVYVNGAFRDSTQLPNYSVTRLRASTLYMLTVKAADQAGNTSVFSNAVISKTQPDITAPTAPSNLSLVGSTITSLKINWDNSTDEMGVTMYYVYVNGIKTDSLTSTSYTISNLLVNTAYSISVKAADLAGNISDFSSALVASTLADVSAPSAPGNLRASNSTLTSLSVNWDNSTDNVGVTRYFIYVNGVVIDSTATLNYTIKNLQINTSYTITVKAGDFAGNVSAAGKGLLASTLADVTAPTAPLNVKVAGSSMTSLFLSWDNAIDNVGVVRYDVYVNGIKRDSTLVPGYLVNNLTASTTYLIAIKAADAAGNVSNSSSTLSGKTLADVSAPTAPGNVTLVSSTLTSLSLTWDNAIDNVGVTRYDVYVNGSKKDFTLVPGYVLNNLTPNSTYIIGVKAADLAGNVSAPSTPLSATTLADTTAPLAPGNLKLTASSLTSLALSWDNATDNVGVTRYDVYVNGIKKDSTVLAKYSMSNLNNNTAYVIAVKAADFAGNVSDFSSPLSAKTLADISAPTAPANLKVVASMNSLALSWNNSSDNVGVTRYDVYVNGVKKDSTVLPKYSLGNLNNNTAYAITVKAADLAGNESEFSSPLLAKTLADISAPTAPANLKVIATMNSLAISWDNASDNVGVTRYDVYVNGVKKDSTVAPNYFLDNLGANTTYTISVKAADLAGNVSAFSSVLPAKTLGDLIAPTAPANLVVSTAAMNSLSISWDNATDNVGVTRYDVYVNGIRKDSTVAPNYTITNLVPNTSYNISVKAADLAGNVSVASSTLAATTLGDLIAPSAPGNLKAVAAMNSLAVSWDNATDNVGVTRYDVYVNGIKADSTVAPNYTLRNLVTNTTYTISVKAADLAGNQSPMSSVLTAFTTGDVVAPTAPSNLQATITSASAVTLSWGKSTDNIGVTQYDVYINGTRKYSTTATGLVADGLVANTSYLFSVKALDLAGNTSLASNQATITIQSSGFQYKYYEGSWTALPNFNNLKPVSTGTTPNIDLSVRRKGVNDNYGFVWEGYIRITKPGMYTFGTLSDAGSKIYFNSLYSPDATALVNNDGLHCAQTASASVYIANAGVYPIAVTYFQKTGGAAMLMYWKGPDVNWQLIPNSAFSDNAAPPTWLSLLTGIFNNIYFDRSCGSATGKINTMNVNTLSASSATFETGKQVEKTFKTYPNPFTDQVNVDFNTGAKSTVNVDVFDLTGKLVYNQLFRDTPAGNNTITINVSDRHLAAGIYILNLTVNGILYKTTRIIKASK